MNFFIQRIQGGRASISKIFLQRIQYKKNIAFCFFVFFFLGGGGGGGTGTRASE